MAELSPGNEQGTRQAIVVALVLVAVALVSLLSTDWPDHRQVAGEAPAPAARAGPSVAGQIADRVQAPGASETEPKLPDVAAAPVLPDAPGQVVPAFDLIRVEPDGAAIIAGTAAPGARVHVQLDGVDVSVTQADTEGNFVALADLGRAEAPRLVTLLSEMGSDTVVSAESAIIEPVTVVAPQVAAVPAANVAANVAANAAPAGPVPDARTPSQPGPQVAASQASPRAAVDGQNMPASVPAPRAGPALQAASGSPAMA
ncbi:MAG TPA: hypothetical protein ENJ52_07465, partial [Aliiroseovarius sp.]|nr:hypothetical protein [Aliiroseovarius sp.]